MPRTIIVVSILFLVPLIALAQTADPGRSWQDVQLTTHDGWVYKGVQVTTDPADPAIVVVTKSDGATRRMPVTDIRMIRDADGRDITNEIIPAPVADVPPGYSEIGVAAPAAAGATASAPRGPRPFSAMLGAGVGFGHPFHTFYEGMQDRISWHVDLRVPVSEATYPVVRYRRQQLFRGVVDVYDYNTDQLIPIDTSIDLNEVLFLVGFLSRPNRSGEARVYFELGAGLGFHAATLSYGGVTGSDSFDRTLLVGQFGVLVGLGQSDVGLDVGISLAAKIFNSEPNESSGFVGGIHAGLTYAFGTP